MIVQKEAIKMNCSAVKPCVFLVKQMNLRALALLLVESLIGGNTSHLASSKPLPGAAYERYLFYFSSFHVEHFKMPLIFDLFAPVYLSCSLNGRILLTPPFTFTL